MKTRYTFHTVLLIALLLGSLYVVVEYLYYKVFSRNILAYLWINDVLLALPLVDALLHYAGADCIRPPSDISAALPLSSCGLAQLP